MTLTTEATCKCEKPIGSHVFIFGAEKCAKCGLLIEPLGEKGCGE